ncbi:PREDICTED: uncharacterized protein LOC106002715 [Dipodomys ordii]|uniref:Uncharacterized protein LOC106002715 n=1 Tax=Dipodomys ordii TaxID=10020 RepID=A0A1S3GVS6_DIPOR|nr:PREDICTED: uncharacterized protein LOC106002715 [Dipodomys ordii]
MGGPWASLLLLLLLLCSPHPAPATRCPRTCACYVPTELHCTFCSLRAVPHVLDPKMERVNLGFNHIRVLTHASFSGLARLQLLLLHGNEIADITKGALSDLGALQVLKLSYNQLRALHTGSLRGLRRLSRLYLDHNRLESVHPWALLGLASLRLLRLDGNRLAALAPEALATLRVRGVPACTLGVLHLAGNRLAALPAGTLARAPALRVLHLQGNPWACSCRARWMEGLQGRGRGVLRCGKEQACAACASPADRRGLDLRRLPPRMRCRSPRILTDPGDGEEPPEAEVEAEEEEVEDGEDVGEVRLRLTDARGRTAHLACRLRHAPVVRDLDVRPGLAPDTPAHVRLTLSAALVCYADPAHLAHARRLLGGDDTDDVALMMRWDPEAPRHAHSDGDLGDGSGEGHAQPSGGDPDGDELYQDRHPDVGHAHRQGGDPDVDHMYQATDSDVGQAHHRTRNPDIGHVHQGARDPDVGPAHAQDRDPVVGHTHLQDKYPDVSYMYQARDPDVGPSRQQDRHPDVGHEYDQDIGPAHPEASFPDVHDPDVGKAYRLVRGPGLSSSSPTSVPGVVARLWARPAWLLQPELTLRWAGLRGPHMHLTWTACVRGPEDPEDAPWVTLDPRDDPDDVHVVTPGQTLRLHCAAQGSETPRVAWTQPDGSVLLGDEDGGHDGGTTLEIHEVRQADAGWYRCEARVGRHGETEGWHVAYSRDGATGSGAYVEEEAMESEAYGVNEAIGSKAYAEEKATRSEAYAEEKATRSEAYPEEKATGSQAYAEEKAIKSEGYDVNEAIESEAYTENEAIGSEAYTEKAKESSAYGSDEAMRSEAYTEEKATKSETYGDEKAIQSEAYAVNEAIESEAYGANEAIESEAFTEEKAIGSEAYTEEKAIGPAAYTVSEAPGPAAFDTSEATGPAAYTSLEATAPTASAPSEATAPAAYAPSAALGPVAYGGFESAMAGRAQRVFVVASRAPAATALTLPEGAALRLGCRAEAEPAARVGWLLPGGRWAWAGTELGTDGVGVGADGTLTLPTLGPRHAGRYV